MTKRTPRFTVALTFDDSLKDHLLIAAPMLEERGWRGTFCIVTDYDGMLSSAADLGVIVRGIR